ncbi:MAG: glycoside hydrolase family 3 C-terminal domain-containing protein, partial [Ignavibacteria bacterium]
GLKAEYFKNKNLEGKPFYSKIDPIDNANFIYGTRIPNLWNLPEFSIRWTGFLVPPGSGTYIFTIKGDDGYRLYINDKIIAEDWTEHTGITSKENRISLEEGRNYNIKIEYFRASDTASNRPQLYIQWEMVDVDNFKKATELAESSELIIFIGGITPQLEGEQMRVDYEGFSGGDRTSLDLPKVQENLLEQLYKTGKPVVLVLTGGSALSVNWAEENIPAILQVWYPGEEGGTALADVLFGDYNPAGRLPVTFYKSVDQLPAFEDYSMKGRTYRYFEGEPLYPFGYGLSYTKFKYSNLVAPDSIKAGEDIKVSVEVQNIGQLEGDEVVQLYVKDPEASVPVPIHSLQGFKRVHLKPGETKIVEFILYPRQISIISIQNEEIKHIVEPGEIEIYTGGMQPNTKAPTTESIKRRLKIIGNPFYMD